MTQSTEYHTLAKAVQHIIRANALRLGLRAGGPTFLLSAICKADAVLNATIDLTLTRNIIEATDGLLRISAPTSGGLPKARPRPIWSRWGPRFACTKRSTTAS